jgi:hypothetical protein
MNNETLKTLEAMEERFKVFKDNKLISDFLKELNDIKRKFYN